MTIGYVHVCEMYNIFYYHKYKYKYVRLQII